jgi:hypothetical protein
MLLEPLVEPLDAAVALQRVADEIDLLKTSDARVAFTADDVSASERLNKSCSVVRPVVVATTALMCVIRLAKQKAVCCPLKQAHVRCSTTDTADCEGPAL